MDVSPDRLIQARAVLIAGPTASGKSALALSLVEAAKRAGRPAVILNADSMQVYRELSVLTARPTEPEEMRVPHRLYGHVRAAERHSVGRWLAEAAAGLAEAEAQSALPIFVGGTGLYFKALTEGLADIPPVPDAIGRSLAEALGRHGPEALYRALRERDPEAAAAIRPSDPQRILRALAVLEATGRSIRAWRAEVSAPLVPASGTLRIVLDPERARLYARIDARFDAMLRSGALEEVKALLALRLDPGLPAMKAIGVRSLTAHLSGDIGLTEAATLAKTETRRYAKRQTTWFRNQMSDWIRWSGDGRSDRGPDAAAVEASRNP